MRISRIGSALCTTLLLLSSTQKCSFALTGAYLPTYKVSRLPRIRPPGFDSGPDYYRINNSGEFQVSFFNSQTSQRLLARMDLSGNISAFTPLLSPTAQYELTGLNNFGDMVGIAGDPSGISGCNPYICGYMKSGANYTLLGLPAGNSDVAPREINDSQQVVGYADTVTGFKHAFLWTSTSGLTDLGSLGGHSYAYDINEPGSVVGVSEKVLGPGRYAIVVRQGIMNELAGIKGLNTVAHAINDLEIIAGVTEFSSAAGLRSAAVAWENDHPKALPNIHSGAAQSVAYYMNNKNEIFGYNWQTGQEYVAVLWKRTAAGVYKVSALQTLLRLADQSQYEVNEVLGTNDLGEVLASCRSLISSSAGSYFYCLLSPQ